MQAHRSHLYQYLSNELKLPHWKVTLSAIYLTHPLYLKALGYFLVVSDPLVKSDAIVVLDGDPMDERLLHSVQLWRTKRVYEKEWRDGDEGSNFRSHSNNMQIDFPKLCTIAYANKIIENCLKAKKGTKPLIFHFDRTTWIDPFAITVIVGTIQCCSKTKKREIRYVPPEDEKLKNYLAQIGFNSFFHIEGKDIHKDTSVELAQLNALKSPLH